MSVSLKDGGPAFPFPSTHATADMVCPRCSSRTRGAGMSLRDYFAGQALAEAIRHERELRQSQIAPEVFRYDAIAKAAYVIADAMLKAREAGQ